MLVILDSVPTVITNKHVVVNSTYGIAQECTIRFSSNGPVDYSIQSSKGQIKFAADGTDIAYLSGLKEWNGPPIISLNDRVASGNVACTSEPNIGDPLVILGYPSYGSKDYTPTGIPNLEITATEGIISGKDSGYYTTSAKIEHGNSGGLAIDKNNNCYLGIPTAAVTGEIESLGRILPASYIFKY